ncbi:MAG: DUF1232 domain-containing protein [Kiritimatiellae bacterium]|nr:DUF1232 domain-containing protein [Kiritimatiellia bacterium]
METMKTNKTINETQAEETLGEFADKVCEEDVKETLGKEDELKKLFRNVKVLAKYFNDLCEILELLRDRVTGAYRETPWRTIAALTGALIYVLSPIDLILDFIPVIGFLDDAIVIGLAIKLAQPDLEKYRAWKASRKEKAA